MVIRFEAMVLSSSRSLLSGALHRLDQRVRGGSPRIGSGIVPLLHRCVCLGNNLVRKLWFLSGCDESAELQSLNQYPGDEMDTAKTSTSAGKKLSGRASSFRTV